MSGLCSAPSPGTLTANWARSCTNWGPEPKSAQDPIDRLLAYDITMDANALLQEALGVLTRGYRLG